MSFVHLENLTTYQTERTGGHFLAAIAVKVSWVFFKNKPTYNTFIMHCIDIGHPKLKHLP